MDGHVETEIGLTNTQSRVGISSEKPMNEESLCLLSLHYAATKFTVRLFLVIH